MAVSPLPAGISILICTYNGAARLVPTLTHIAQQVVTSQVQWEVLLVDNNSTDDTAASSLAQWNNLGAPAPLRLLSQPKPGKQFALEMAYDAAQYEFMCIVDDDNWLHAGYLQKGYDLMLADSTIGLLGGKNVGAFEVEPPAWFAAFQSAYAVGEPVAYVSEGKRKFTTGEITTGVLWGAGLFVRHTIWRKLRLLGFKSLFTGRQGDSQLTAGEDDELSQVTRLLGYKLWYDEALSCTHYMTAGRLTESYLKRLSYAAPRAYIGLAAYQKVLSPARAKYYSLIPWLKDVAYISSRAAREVLSWQYIKSYWQPDLQTQIAVNQRLLTLRYFTVHFGEARQDFQRVLDFYNRIHDNQLALGED